MASLRIFIACTMFMVTSAGSLFAQVVGDYGSKATGNWGTDGTNWIVCTSPGTWTGATDPAPSAPSQTTNAWIRSGHTVTVEASGKNSLNLTVETGASLVGNLSHPTGTINYLRIYGTTATINGVFGGSSSPGTNIALEPATSDSTLTITGSGTFQPSRVRVNSGASGVTTVFAINTTFRYTGSAGTGGVGLYPATEGDTFTINSGKTLTFANNSGMGVGSGEGSAAATNLTINVHGAIDLSQPNSTLTLKVLPGKTATMTIFPGASVTVGGDAFASTVADGGTTVITVNGSFTAGGNIDFTKPSFVVTGSGTFAVADSANLMIGHPAGIASAGATGQIQTATRTFAPGGGYSYQGSAAQITGSGLPSTVGNLTINNDSSVSLSNSVTVGDTLRLLGGQVITGANTLAMSSSGIVSRADGHVVGSLQKNVATGSGVARTFEIGTGNRYAPVSVTFASVSTGGNLVASTTAGDHPNLAAGTIDVAKSVNRYWTLTSTGTVFTTYNATFNFVPGDVDAGAGPGLFIAEKHNGGVWSGLTEGTLTSTSTQITGATSFSEFAVGQPEGAPATPVFEVSTSSLSLGNVVVGNPSSDTVVIRNIGTATLSVTSILSTNTPVFTVSPASATLSAGDTAFVAITFTPSAPGSTSAGIVFTHNATGSPDTLAASGTGLSGPILSNGTGGGNWNNSLTWQGGVVPDDIDSVVILGTDSVVVSADTSCLGLSIQAGGKLALYDTLEVDFVTVSGSVVVHDNARFNVIEGGTFGNGSSYNHARDGGNLPVVTWGTGSTWSITGLVSTAPANGNQSFYNVIWNAPGQIASVNLGWDSIAIGGNITISNTGLGIWRMTAPVTNDSAWVVINGDIIQSGGSFTSTGTSNPNTKITIDVYGNIVVTGGNFSVSRGSQGGTGTTRWNLYGDFSMSNASHQNSNNAGAKFVFAKNGIQNLSYTNVTIAAGSINFTVNSTSTLDVGTSVLAGSGSFILNPGATLRSGHANGVNGNITSTGVNGGGNLFNTAANYTFNGAVSQGTGTLLPDILNNLAISNSLGVACSDSFLVNGTLSITSGDLNLNGKMITLGPSALLSETAGNTVSGSSGVITTTRTLNAPGIATDIAGLGINIGSAANLGSTVLTRGHAVQTANGVSIKRYFDITPTTNTGLSASLRLHYDDSELNGTNEPSLLLYRSTNSGASWVLGGGTVNTGANTVDLTGVNDLARLTAAGDISVSVSLAAGWNLISNPITVPAPSPGPHDSIKTLFPAATFPYGFRFAGALGYQQEYRLVNGVGYWEKFASAGVNDFTGLGSGRPTDSLVVAAGWNIVGSVTGTVDTASILTDPGTPLSASHWFKYQSGYPITATIEQGKGYWKKATRAGKFYLTGAEPASRPALQPTKASVNPLDALNRVVITDSKGGSQTLYFGSDVNNEISVPSYEMPPVPPAGAFDARFSAADGGFMVRTHPSVIENIIDLPVAVQSDAYPLTVSWKVASGSYTLSDAVGGQAFAPKSMTGEGSAQISSNKFTIKVTGGSEVPTEFALSQNYPNPFNPTTNIRFALPVQSRVAIDIYNVLGQKVRTLLKEDRQAGYHAAEWNGTGNAGQQLGSGVYFLQLSATGANGKSFNEVRKLMMLK